VPYLRPYDAFEYLPVAADQLSALRTRRLDTYRLRKGMILQTCSGRNLGPALMVDDYLARFVLSHDMVRIEIEDEQMRYYVLAFLQSETGQQLLKRDKTGSVIDHISDSHVAAMEIPLFSEKARKAVSNAMREAVTLREEARVELSDLLEQYEAKLPDPSRTNLTKIGWTFYAEDFGTRLDAANHDPVVPSLRKKLMKIGGAPVKTVAKVMKPAGRYKTYYVEPEYGRPILSGAQLLQAHPINLRYMSPRAFKSVTPYELKQGWIAYPADGRAEEALGLPSLITSDRDGWLASGHVGRLVPRDGVSPGWLWLACRTQHVQMQIKAAASGSVVDSTFPADMEDVILPPPLSIDTSHVEAQWEKFSRAQRAESDATAIVENELERLVEKA